jgi:hypothetical protein
MANPNGIRQSGVDAAHVSVQNNANVAPNKCQTLAPDSAIRRGLRSECTSGIPYVTPLPKLPIGAAATTGLTNVRRLIAKFVVVARP